MNYKYDWGQEVTVNANAPKNLRPGELGEICGIRESEGRVLYLIEFSDGEASEIPEHLIEAFDVK